MATLAQQLTAAQSKLAEYSASESEALQAQEVRLTTAGGVDRNVVMADLGAIRRGITYWQSVCSGLEAKIAGQPTFGGLPFSSANFGN